MLADFLLLACLPAGSATLSIGLTAEKAATSFFTGRFSTAELSLGDGDERASSAAPT